jgi:meso-butanediol dehydrogenase / (S,S)-butanediol dehydrogenase / diacetyl reductase
MTPSSDTADAGRVVVLTGAASGIGYATAEKFLAGGDTVIGLDLASSVPEGVEYHQVNVADKASVTAAFAAIGEKHGHIDVLLNVAGISQFGRIETIEEAEWDRVVDVNLKGVFFVIQAALPWVRKAEGATGTPGNVVNVSSITGIAAQPYTAAYTASKGGVTMLTKGLALELAAEGIRVNCVCPGMVETPLVEEVAGKITGDLDPRAMDRMMMLLPHASMKPSEIADALHYLAGARSVTGVALPIDGGMDG